MTRSYKLWQIGLALFALVNLAGAVYAAAMSEPMHAMVHVALFVAGLGAYAVLRVVQRGRRQPIALAEPADQRLDYLQQSVDAIALEVERLGEGQRYRDKLRAEQGETPPLKKPPEEV